HNRTPLVEFLSKGAHFSSLTGEKLSEYQVTRAVEQVTQELGTSLTTYSLAPCWDDEVPYYGLFVERSDLANFDQARRLAEGVDERLARLNSEYACKRETRRLAAVRLALLPTGAWQRWDLELLARTGGSAEQYKHPCLIPDLGFRDRMPVEEEIEIT